MVSGSKTLFYGHMRWSSDKEKLEVGSSYLTLATFNFLRNWTHSYFVTSLRGIGMLLEMVIAIIFSRETVHFSESLYVGYVDIPKIDNVSPLL